MRYSDPPGLEVQIWQGENTLFSKPCVDSADIAAEARRQFNIYCQQPDPTPADPVGH